MIEVVLADTCISCGKCALVCPNDVFDGESGDIPVIARQDDCVTCYLCEAYCPADALYVSPIPAPDSSVDIDAIRAGGGTGIRPQGGSKLDAREVIKAVQDEILPLEKNYFRSGPTILGLLGLLNKVWSDAREDLSGGNAREVLKAREAAALVASSRWIYSAALERKETRGLHRRSDFPERDESQRHNLRVGGLDQVSVSVVDVRLTLPPAE